MNTETFWSLPESVHVAPLTHGLLSHSSKSTSQLPNLSGCVT